MMSLGYQRLICCKRLEKKFCRSEYTKSNMRYPKSIAVLGRLEKCDDTESGELPVCQSPIIPASDGEEIRSLIIVSLSSNGERLFFMNSENRERVS